MREHAMPVHTIQVSEAAYRRLSERAAQLHGLFMNDSLIVAVMQRERIQVLPTNDSDFKRIPGIAVRVLLPST
jgi:predicted nucleic acid-binding protein